MVNDNMEIRIFLNKMYYTCKLKSRIIVKKAKSICYFKLYLNFEHSTILNDVINEEKVFDSCQIAITYSNELFHSFSAHGAIWLRDMFILVNNNDHSTLVI